MVLEDPSGEISTLEFKVGSGRRRKMNKEREKREFLRFFRDAKLSRMDGYTKMIIIQRLENRALRARAEKFEDVR
jgi:hypothetical protein